MTAMSYLQRNTPAFRRANLALFAGGFSTFAILWGTQPLLPEIAEEFHVSPAMASLTQSSATIALAVGLLVAGSLSEVFGRKSIMAFSLFISSVIALFTGLSSSFELLVLSRALQGLTLAGLPAVAMAYLGEEVEFKSLGMAMGLYISGNSIGGMSGRILSGILTDYFSWHVALAGVGALSLLASFAFFFLLPPSRHFEAKSFNLLPLIRSMGSHLKVRGLVYLFLIGFLLMSGFVSLYNYIGFELTAPPYSLSQTLVGFIFIVYIVGTFSSTWMGMLADQMGKKKILLLCLFIFLVGTVCTLHPALWIKILGIAIFTFGFFAAHSIASSWVGLLATHDKAQASSLYLFGYYAGSSIGGTVSGSFYHGFGWAGIVGMIVILGAISVVLALSLSERGKMQEIY